MAALVRYYLSKGLKVAGYDRTRTALTDELTAEGAEITYDDAAELIPAIAATRRPHSWSTPRGAVDPSRAHIFPRWRI